MNRMPVPVPLERMPPGGPPGVHGLAFDVDDTVTEAGRLRSEALAAMERLAAAGWTLVAVTGRPLGWAEAMSAQWPVHLVIGENGAGWCWREEASTRLHYRSFLQGDAAQVARESLRRCAERIRTTLGLPEAEDQAGRRWDRAFLLPEGSMRTRFETLAHEHGLGAFFSSVHAHLSAGWNKAEGFRQGAEARFGRFDASQWLFVGDGLNDAPLFAALPYTVGVANVAPVLHQLPTPPRWTTNSPRAAGFAELAAHLLTSK